MSELQLPPSIDPNKLIVQEGFDIGRIEDASLAYVGADNEETEYRKNNSDSIVNESFHKNPDFHSENAMAFELKRRAEAQLPDDDTVELKQARIKVGDAAYRAFLTNIEKAKDNRPAEIAASTEALLNQLHNANN